MPWWGLVFAAGLALIFTLPISIITATTNQTPGLNVITEYIMGVILPGRPIANVCFKTYGYISMTQAVSFLNDFKLGHYMKIPPRSMFIVQCAGTIIAGTINIATAWWLLTSIENICQDNLLPPNSPWTCPNDRVFFDASVIWGLVSPKKKNLRKPWELRRPQLVLPRRRLGTCPRLGPTQGLPQPKMDQKDKPSSTSGRHSGYATGYYTELQQLDFCRDYLQLLCFSVQESVVAEVQLRSFSSSGCRAGFHGGAAVFLA